GARTTCTGRTAGTRRRTTRTGRTTCTRPASSSTTTAEAAEGKATAATKAQAADITAAHRSIPGGLDRTGFRVDRDTVVDAVVDEHVGVGAKAERAVLVLVRRSCIGSHTAVVAGPPGVALDRREVHRLGVLEGQLLEGVVGAHAEAAEQQVGDRTRLAHLV